MSPDRCENIGITVTLIIIQKRQSHKQLQDVLMIPTKQFTLQFTRENFFVHSIAFLTEYIYFSFRLHHLITSVIHYSILPIKYNVICANELLFTSFLTSSTEKEFNEFFSIEYYDCIFEKKK
jgi:hypothetical protein